MRSSTKRAPLVVGLLCILGAVTYSNVYGYLRLTHAIVNYGGNIHVATPDGPMIESSWASMTLDVVFFPAARLEEWVRGLP